MLGSYDECLDIQNDTTQYCLASIALDLPIKTPLPLVFSVGMCVPQECTVANLTTIVNTIPGLKIQANPMKPGSLVDCQPYKNPPYDAKAIIMIFVCFLIVTIVLASTITDLFVRLWKDGTIHHYFPLPPRPKSNSDVSDDEPLLLGPVVPKKKPSKCDPMEWVQAFSLYKTLGTVFSTKQTSAAITCINGIRVLSILWVIICHAYVWVFQYTGADNTLNLLQTLKRFSFQVISNGFFSVDSFFLLSGLLGAYLTLRQMQRRKGKFPFVMYYVHRYLRLTPVYAFVVFFYWFLLKQLGNGPTYGGLSSYFQERCDKYWWTNFLYINNIYPWKIGDECLGWSWYLANDMQFFVISPLIIIPMYFLFPLGIAIVTGLLLGSFISTGVLAGVFDIQANTFAAFAYGYNTTVTEDTSDLLYTKPWHRIQPYLVGLVIGYLLFKQVRVPFNRYFKLVSYLVLWALAIILSMGTVYGLYGTWNGHVPSPAENIIYLTFSRFAFSLGVGLLVYICHNGYGGWINTFLSMKMWIPAGRLAFNAYLIHPVILTVVFGDLRSPMHITDVEMAVYAVGLCTLSFGAAFLLTVFVEFPFGNLEVAFFKLFGVGARESTRTATEAKDHATHDGHPPNNVLANGEMEDKKSKNSEMEDKKDKKSINA